LKISSTRNGGSFSFLTLVEVYDVDANRIRTLEHRSYIGNVPEPSLGLLLAWGSRQLHTRGGNARPRRDRSQEHDSVNSAICALVITGYGRGACGHRRGNRSRSGLEVVE
jgi:hypothetical protein